MTVGRNWAKFADSESNLVEIQCNIVKEPEKEEQEQEQKHINKQTNKHI